MDYANIKPNEWYIQIKHKDKFYYNLIMQLINTLNYKPLIEEKIENDCILLGFVFENENQKDSFIALLRANNIGFSLSSWPASLE